jgi:hypothetical protein
MEPGGFQSLQHIRGVYIGFDSGFALSRCEVFAAANCVGAGLVSHGPFTRPKRRYLCFANAACGADTCVIAIRLASESIWQDDFSDCVSRDAGHGSRCLDMGSRGQLQVFAGGYPFAGSSR